MSNASVRCAAIARGRALGLRQALAGSGGGQHNARASFRIGGSGVVLQRDAQMAADVRQARGAQLPGGARQPHCAGKGLRGLRQAGGRAAGLHDGAVKAGVVRCEKGSAGQQRLQLRPELRKDGGAGHLLPADAVQVGEDHARARRADVMKGALHNHAGFHAHQRQRTSAVTPVVRGFKIDGDEGGRGGGCVKWHWGWHNGNA